MVNLVPAPNSLGVSSSVIDKSCRSISTLCDSTMSLTINGGSSPLLSSPNSTGSGIGMMSNCATTSSYDIVEEVANENNSMSICHEIQRFESVHPSIYAIYDLIELVPDSLLAQQIREHVVCIEDSFVNSQEWTVSRSVPDIRLGIVGSLSSGKSALVHRYLTGAYMQEESPEGGRFKKEIVVDGQSYLLLIRDEGGLPEKQFTSWIDAVIFVFSLENEQSFNSVYNFYLKMCQYRNMQEIPLFLVGTQDSISDVCPRVIDELRARKLAGDLKRCSYYETCATYGLNVDRVFHDACRKVTTMLHSSTQRPQNLNATSSVNLHQHNSNKKLSPNHHSTSSIHLPPPVPAPTSYFAATVAPTPPSTSSNKSPSSISFNHSIQSRKQNETHHKGNTVSKKLGFSSAPSSEVVSGSSNSTKSKFNHQFDLNFNNVIKSHLNKSGSTAISNKENQQVSLSSDSLDVTRKTPNSTPNANRKKGGGGGVGGSSNADNVENIGTTNLPTEISVSKSSNTSSRRRSNIFVPSSKKHQDKHSKGGGGGEDSTFSNPAAYISESLVGSGRSIPILQGYLYKKSCKSFSKEWKKKYVTLCDNGIITYHPSLNDYMDNVHGKSIPLQCCTVKIPGQKPRGSRTVKTLNNTLSSTASTTNLHSATSTSNKSSSSSNNKNSTTAGNPRLSLGGNSAFKMPLNLNNDNDHRESGEEVKASVETTPNLKKRHRRLKSNTGGGGVGSGSSGEKANNNNILNDCGDDSNETVFEFQIVSLDNKQWHFEVNSCDEREQWVSAIEAQILSSLQSGLSAAAASSNPFSSVSHSTSTNSMSNNGTNVNNSLISNGDNFLSDRRGTSALHDMSATSKMNQAAMNLEMIKRIKSEVEGNARCVDCDKPNPEWASINLGALMCIDCSGVHRQLGAHISRVRSLNLDEWPAAHLAVMSLTGNAVANSIWEATLSSSSSVDCKPNPSSSPDCRENFIVSKYRERAFLASIPHNASPTSLLLDSICRCDMRQLCLSLLHCTPDDVNGVINQQRGDLRTPLHFAASLGNLSIVQLLLWSSADVKTLDGEGRSALYYAQNSPNPNSMTTQDLVDLLKNLGCPQTPNNNNYQSTAKKNLSSPCSPPVLSQYAVSGHTQHPLSHHHHQSSTTSLLQSVGPGGTTLPRSNKGGFMRSSNKNNNNSSQLTSSVL